ncbi:MAG: hypothetical protein ACJAYU_003675 [Bradymonadia bacterium]|jgi:hypothetical protein
MQALFDELKVVGAFWQANVVRVAASVNRQIKGLCAEAEGHAALRGEAFDFVYFVADRHAVGVTAERLDRDCLRNAFFGVENPN